MAGIRPSRASANANVVPSAATATSAHATRPAPPPIAGAVDPGDHRLGAGVDAPRMRPASAIRVREVLLSEVAARRASSRGRRRREKAVPAPRGPRRASRRRPQVAERPASAASAPGQGVPALGAVQGERSRPRPRGRPRRRSHPEHPEAWSVDRRARRRVEAEREHLARVERVDHAVVPQPRGGVVGVALPLVALDVSSSSAGSPPTVVSTLPPAAAHHRDPRVRPHPELRGP